MDIAIPKGNEEEMLQMAKKLGNTSLRFLYPAVSIAQKEKLNGREVGIISDNPNEIHRAKQQGIFAATSSNEMRVLESSPDMLFGVEDIEHKDSLHFRKSGLNQVLCALMAKNGISYGISFSMVLHSSNRGRALLMGRIAQNVRLTRKFKIPVQIYSFAKEPYSLRARKDLDAVLRTFSR